MCLDFHFCVVGFFCPFFPQVQCWRTASAPAAARAPSTGSRIRGTPALRGACCGAGPPGLWPADGRAGRTSRPQSACCRRLGRGVPLLYPDRRWGARNRVWRARPCSLGGAFGARRWSTRNHYCPARRMATGGIGVTCASAPPRFTMYSACACESLARLCAGRQRSAQPRPNESILPSAHRVPPCP